MGTIKIIRKQIVEYYTAENGDHVSITITPDDAACLIVCHPVNNEMYFKQDYKSRRGALVAMHRKCGKCKFNFMTETFRKEGVT